VVVMVGDYVKLRCRSVVVSHRWICQDKETVHSVLVYMLNVVVWKKVITVLI
jgi:hypothetical protein